MLNTFKWGLLVATGIISFTALAAPKTYQIDPTHTSVIVTWNHFGFSNPTASFADASGTITFDAENPAKSSVSVTIPVKSVDTRVAKLTEEFLSKTYFDTAAFPNATFKSNKVVKKGDKAYDIYGDMTIKGITKPVVLHATLNHIGEHPMTKKQAVGFDATTEINRKDFGLDMYVPYVSNKVSLHISTEAEQQ